MARQGPAPLGTENITSPEQYAGKKIGVWDFGNEYEVTAAGLKAGLTQNVDYQQGHPAVRHGRCCSTREIDVAEAMIYNEYAQVLESKNPETGELSQPTDLNVINYNDVGTAMLQDAIFARAGVARPGRQRGHRDQVPAGVVQGLDVLPRQPGQVHPVHRRRRLDARRRPPEVDDERDPPLIWPSPNGIGQMPVDTWAQTVAVAKDSQHHPGRP